MLILRPRASRMAPREAAAMPFPSEETTPPVTNTNWVICWTPESGAGNGAAEFGKTDYKRGPSLKGPRRAVGCFPGKTPYPSAEGRMIPPLDAQARLARLG